MKGVAIAITILDVKALLGAAAIRNGRGAFRRRRHGRGGGGGGRGY